MFNLLSNNLFNASNVVVSSENAQFPLLNLSDPRRTKVYRSTSNSDNLVLDLGIAEAVDTLMIVDNWQDGFSVNTITLEGNNTNSWTSPAFSESIPINSEFGVAVKQFTETSLRFWRIVVTSSLGYCELANIFLGKASKIETNGVGYNWNYSTDDLSDKSKNRYGQEFIDDYGSVKNLENLPFSVMNKDEQDIILEAWDLCRTTYPLFIYFPLEDGNASNDHDRYNGMYKFKSKPVFTNTTQGYFATVLNLVENK